MTHQWERFERAARSDFDKRVAAATGSRGWEAFGLLVLSAGCLAVALLLALTVTGWPDWRVYAFAAPGLLCLSAVLTRWLRPPRPPR
ncbi:hypothetical protein [Actinacidiphila sp. ITFR-21]|uniref:hypothetical protein n=1 Tax=Actinacidiphila sp. ITFR-21 TaxID=3075199 RepID=UPI00288B093E|nr:hypothetical protein [Streptomyces sp. ITFR-21]WNI17042.1 hypothetical protein RLT57_16965 [Streptomyces sp. ITFR-21]